MSTGVSVVCDAGAKAREATATNTPKRRRKQKLLGRTAMSWHGNQIGEIDIGAGAHVPQTDDVRRAVNEMGVALVVTAVNGSRTLARNVSSRRTLTQKTTNLQLVLVVLPLATRSSNEILPTTDIEL